MIRRLSILGFVFFLTSICQAQKLCAIDNQSFQSGERLQYQLYYNLGFVWIQAGTCEFRVRTMLFDKKPVFQLMAFGKTQKSFDSFYKVRDTIVSYVDSNTILPYKAYKFTHEDNWNGIDEFSFWQEQDGWRIRTRLKRKQHWKDPVESFTTKCGFDIVTSIYRLRCMTDEKLFVKGRRTELPVRLDDGEYNLFLTYMGKERIKLYGGGYYSAHAFHLTLIEGNIFKRSDVLKMWISDDGNKIPLLIESPIRVGTVKALFRGAEKTLHPLTKAGLK